MTLLTSSDLFDTLQTTGLLEAAQLEELRQAAPSTADSRNLARWLLDRGYLTAYQANQLLSGRGRNLVLGSYVLLERLGEGGMGQVFKARHVRLGRIAALKVIRKDRFTDPAAIRRFHREIHAVAQLSHPNIVLAFDADEVNGQHFFTMEYVEGVSLAQQVKGGGPLTVASACEYIRQAALGLQHAHQLGMVHRDIKPSNLLLSWNTRPVGVARTPMPGRVANTSVGEVLVKILDMGLALLQMPEVDDTEASETLTQKGVLLGTPDFIAAEQASNPHNADIRSDLYSLGCTFYYLLTGRVPFPGGTTIDKLFRHRLEEPAALDKLRPGVPAVVGAVVRKLMAKSPKDRYQTPGELADHLFEVMTGLRRQGGAVEILSSVDEEPTPFALEVSDDQPADTAAALPSSPWGARLRTRTTATLRRYRKSLGVCFGLCILAAGVGGLLFAGGRWSPASVPPPSRASEAGATNPLLGRKYVLKNSREETVLATLRANGLPTLEGKWSIVGPFDNFEGKSGFGQAYPPEKEAFGADKSYTGKGGATVSWKEFPAFKPGAVVNLRVFEDDDESCCYLYHSFTVAEPVDLPVLCGFDDTGVVWLNGERVASRGPSPGWVQDQRLAVLKCRAGKNEVLVKVCNWRGAWEVYLFPTFPAQLETMFGATLKRDFSKPPRSTESGKHGGAS